MNLEWNSKKSPEERNKSTDEHAMLNCDLNSRIVSAINYIKSEDIEVKISGLNTLLQLKNEILFKQSLLETHNLFEYIKSILESGTSSRSLLNATFDCLSMFAIRCPWFTQIIKEYQYHIISIDLLETGAPIKPHKIAAFVVDVMYIEDEAFAAILNETKFATIILDFSFTFKENPKEIIWCLISAQAIVVCDYFDEKYQETAIKFIDMANFALEYLDPHSKAVSLSILAGIMSSNFSIEIKISCIQNENIEVAIDQLCGSDIESPSFSSLDYINNVFILNQNLIQPYIEQIIGAFEKFTRTVPSEPVIKKILLTMTNFLGAGETFERPLFESAILANVMNFFEGCPLSVRHETIIFFAHYLMLSSAEIIESYDFVSFSDFADMLFDDDPLTLTTVLAMFCKVNDTLRGKNQELLQTILDELNDDSVYERIQDLQLSSNPEVRGCAIALSERMALPDNVEPA